MTQLSVQNSDNQRFQQLLAPIRDLTENWNIDLASQLEEYIEEVGQIAITFDNGRTRIDFVEAALLIQGSTQVFSKKVEYLYTLVLQTLELLTNRKKTEQPSSPRAARAHNNNNNNENLLSLDDLPTRESLLNGEGPIKDKKLISETPTVMLEAPTCVQKTSLYSSTGEACGHRQDFNLLTGTPHFTGAHLLEPSLASYLAREQNTIENTIPLYNNSPVYTDAGCDRTAYDSPNAGSPMTPLRSPPAHPPTAALALMLSAALNTNTSIQLQPSVLSKHPLLAALNPYEQARGQRRPFKRGKTYRVPAALSATAVPGKRRRDTQPVESGLVEQLTSGLWSDRKHFPKSSIVRLSFLSLEPAFWQEQKRRGDMLKRLQKLAALQRSKADSSVPILKYYSQIESPHADYGSDNETDYPPDDLPDDPNPEQDLPPQHIPNFQLHTEMPLLSDSIANTTTAGYARKVKNYLNALRQSAHTHAQSSALSTRVEEWRRYVSPILETEAKECVFDIRESSLSLVSLIKSHSDVTIGWSQLTNGLRPNEKACQFLTSLVLANNYNIKLDTGESDDVTISLLNDRFAFEDVAHFLAPSLET